jgi:hypothetical protein
MPTTVSTNSPSANVRPSTSRPSPTKNDRHRVEVRDGDADTVKTSYVRHELRPPGFWCREPRLSSPSAGEPSRPALLDMESRIHRPDGGTLTERWGITGPAFSVVRFR